MIKMISDDQNPLPGWCLKEASTRPFKKQLCPLAWASCYFSPSFFSKKLKVPR